MSLYGIESEADCREKIDELLELHARAERTMNKESIRIIKDRLARPKSWKYKRRKAPDVFS